MKLTATTTTKAICVIMLMAAAMGCDGLMSKKVKRVGMMVGLNPKDISDYKILHSDSNPGVRDLLNKYNMHNFSIFLHQIEGKWYAFGYYEYTGDDFEADMAKMNAEPCIRAWLKVCGPMQLPLKGEKSWATMEQVHYNE